MTASAITSMAPLAVPVLQHPHWRVNLRPSTYVASRVQTLSDCIDLLHKTRVRLRGWDFPFVPTQPEFEFGDTWVAGSSDFMGHLEYWRFYQSSQFLYLGSVREVTDPEWAEKIRTTMKWHARDRVNIDEVPGFLSVVECVYNLTEYFEFAARLAQAEVYTDSVTVSISIKGIKGFMLAADHNRLWKPDFVATQDEFHYSHAYSPADLVSSAAEEALRCTTWLFERFGWLHPNLDVLRSDQQKLLTQKF